MKNADGGLRDIEYPGYRTKIVNSKQALILLFASALAVSCSPEPRIDVLTGGREVSVVYVKSMYRGRPVVIDEELDIMATVVSSDKQGNIYKSLFVEDATSGIEIMLDMEDIYLTYNVGVRLHIRAKGLVLGSYGGMLRLGAEGDADHEAGHVPMDRIASHISIEEYPSSEYLPEPVDMAALSERHIGRYIALDEVQFVEYTEGEGPVRWCDGEADTDRVLVDARGNRILVRTSWRSMFSQWTLPRGSGYIEGVLTYFNGNYQLRVIDVHNVFMERPRFEVALFDGGVVRFPETPPAPEGIPQHVF